MSLQVSNQNPSGRRTPQVYQGFGGVVAAPSVTTTPTSTNGGGPTSGGPPNVPGSVGRPAKGNNKQSQIPVAIGSNVGTPSNHDTTAPQTAMLHSDATPGKKQLQSDHLYGMKQQQGGSMVVPVLAGANRSSTTNGSQPAANEKLRKSSTGSGEGMGAAKKPEPSPTQLPVVVEGGAAKGRAAPNARAQEKQTSDEVATAKGLVQQQPKSEKKVVAENSLLMEKSLKGFSTDGEEMDSLVFDTWDLEDTQSLACSSAGKFKMQKATPQGKSQDAESGSKVGEKSPAKLDTVAAQNKEDAKKAQVPDADVVGDKNRSPKVTPKSVEPEVPSTPTNDDGGESLIGRPLRSISGRRSTRPISDIKFTHQRRSAANDSISSMNVTIGSEIGNDSLLLRTPGSVSRKRKDMTPESTSDDGPVAESPKRARLDFSGLLGMVATPVTMLKNRLSRVKLHSTPRSLAVDEEDASKVVTAEATTTTANNTSAEKEADDAGNNAMEVDVKEAKEKSDEAGQMPEKDTEGQQQPEGSSATSVVDDEVEVKIVTDQQQPQKQWCSIM